MKKYLFMLLFLPLVAIAGEEEKLNMYVFLNQVIAGWAATNQLGAGVNRLYLMDQAVFDDKDGQAIIDKDSMYVPGYLGGEYIRHEDLRKIAGFITTAKEFYFEEEKFTSARLVSVDKLHELSDRKKSWSDVKHEAGILGSRLYYFSVPVFFDNGRKAIFYYSYYCGGSCGEGMLAIYENQHGHWVQKTIVKQWFR